MAARQRSWGTIPSLALLATGTQATAGVPLRGGRMSIRIAWTGTPTGVLALQTSYDGSTWITVPGADVEFTANGQAQPAGGASGGVYNWSNVPGTAFRILYTATSGTGALTGAWEMSD